MVWETGQQVPPPPAKLGAIWGQQALGGSVPPETSGTDGADPFGEGPPHGRAAPPPLLFMLLSFARHTQHLLRDARRGLPRGGGRGPGAQQRPSRRLPCLFTPTGVTPLARVP